MINNFRNKDTLEVFNDRWKANHNIKRKLKNQKKKDIINYSPVGRINNMNNNINLVNKINSNNFNNKMK